MSAFEGVVLMDGNIFDRIGRDWVQKRVPRALNIEPDLFSCLWTLDSDHAPSVVRVVVQQCIMAFMVDGYPVSCLLTIEVGRVHILLVSPRRIRARLQTLCGDIIRAIASV